VVGAKGNGRGLSELSEMCYKMIINIKIFYYHILILRPENGAAPRGPARDWARVPRTVTIKSEEEADRGDDTEATDAGACVAINPRTHEPSSDAGDESEREFVGFSPMVLDRHKPPVHLDQSCGAPFPKPTVKALGCRREAF
jgi:hypothetical protein